MELVDNQANPVMSKFTHTVKNRTEYLYCHTLSEHTVPYLPQWL